MFLVVVFGICEHEQPDEGVYVFYQPDGMPETHEGVFVFLQHEEMFVFLQRDWVTGISLVVPPDG